MLTETVASGLLTEEQIRQFIVDGYVVVQPSSLDASFHEAIYERALDWDRPEFMGLGSVTQNNLQAHFPELDAVFADDVVKGALTSVLGPNPLQSDHSYLHTTGTADQLFHKDPPGTGTGLGRGRIRTHRPDWILFSYYPQDTTLDLGPTEIIPGSQYWTTDWPIGPDGPVSEDSPGTIEEFHALRVADIETREQMLDAQLGRLGHPWLRRQFLIVPAGSVALLHYDLFHKGSRQAPDANRARFMFKFGFSRTTEAQQPSWDARDAGDADFPTKPPELQRVWRHVRAAMAGDHTPPAPPAEPIAELASRLTATTEAVRINAAYGLAAAVQHGGPAGDQALSHLIAGLRSDVESERRAAGYGLAAAGPAAAEAVVPVLADGHPHGRAHAVFVIGETGFTPETAVLLGTVLEEDDDDLVRSCAAVALGRLAQTAIARGDRDTWLRAGAVTTRELENPDQHRGVRGPLATALVSISSLGDDQGEWYTDAAPHHLEVALADPEKKVYAMAQHATQRVLRVLPPGNAGYRRLLDCWAETLLARRWSPWRPAAKT